MSRYPHLAIFLIKNSLNISIIHLFLHDFKAWEEKELSAIEIAARIHQRLAWIHPFENGNGRWARLMTNIYLHQKGLSLIQWPSDQQVIKDTLRREYLATLQSADGGNFTALIKFHERLSQ